MTNMINNTPSSDVAAIAATTAAAAAAAAIASTTFAIPTNIAIISITGQKTAGAALITASVAAKAIRLQTTIDAGIDDKGTVRTEITQDQANKIYRIQTNLDKYATSIEGMSSFLRKLGHQK